MLSNARHYPLSHAKVQALVTPKPTKKRQVYFGRFYLWKRRRMPGGSGAARDPKAVVGSPGNTLWAKNAKYEYGCYLSIILSSQNNR
ncbi:hypothetical protein, partial [Collinsella aerofaciens]|uniref:hypothetical protein n=1 Tax=Collinsella aerofaciens TaxID=74426 RepID=UPI00325AC08C